MVYQTTNSILMLKIVGSINIIQISITEVTVCLTLHGSALNIMAIV